LANSGYRRLFTAQTVSRWGDMANAVALVVLVYQLTGNSGLCETPARVAKQVSRPQ
jgi:hypothetical protein